MSNGLVMTNPLELAVNEAANQQSGKLATVQSLSRSQLYTRGTKPRQRLLHRASAREQISWGFVIAAAGAQYQEVLDIVRGFASWSDLRGSRSGERA